MPAALKAVRGYLENRVLVLPSAGPFSIGSALEADLTLHGGEIEERHAVVVADAGGHRLVPVARGRTRLRGATLEKPTPLRDGDEVELGTHRFVYVAVAPADAGKTGSASEPATDCHACGLPVAQDGRALRIGKDVVCGRCVDRRLAVDRDLAAYKVLRKIGQNEEEVTYLAIEPGTNDRVGLRMLKADRGSDPRVLRRFLARALCGLVLGHPNFLEVRGLRHSRGMTFAVIDVLDGGTKLERLARGRNPLSPAGGLKVAEQLAEVLRFARGRRLVVAKRKRTSVVVDRKLQVKVMSFDITRELEEVAVRTAAFRHVLSTAGLDPEPYVKAGPLPPRNAEDARLGQLAPEPAEVYSTGRILFQLVTGRTFSPSATLAELRAAQVRLAAGRPPLPEGSKWAIDRLPRPVVELLDRVLVPAGPNRIQSLELLLAATRDATRALGDAATSALELEISDIEDTDDV